MEKKWPLTPVIAGGFLESSVIQAQTQWKNNYICYRQVKNAGDLWEGLQSLN